MVDQTPERMTGIMLVKVVVFLGYLLSWGVADGQGGEVARLSLANRAQFVPSGKEVDAIEGDWVIRNDRLVAVIAQPTPWRKANMTVGNVGGMIIDLTRREVQSDQLSCFYVTANQFNFHDPKRLTITVDGQEADLGKAATAKGKELAIKIVSAPNSGGVICELTYRLLDGSDEIQILTTFRNDGAKAASVPLRDAFRADRTFVDGLVGERKLCWIYDPWFEQAYGVTSSTHTPRRGKGRGVLVEWVDDSGDGISIPSKESLTLVRSIQPARDLLELQGRSRQSMGESVSKFQLEVVDAAGPVKRAKVTARRGDEVFGYGYTNETGHLQWHAPEGALDLTVEALGRPAVNQKLEIQSEASQVIRMKQCGFIAVNVTDGKGVAIPCKVSFYGMEKTASPDFGPDSLAFATKNTRYAHNGMFRQEIAPGKYQVVISHGPEYDAFVTEVEVERGETTAITATLPRVVETKGWVSTEYHSHSSPSGDNTGSQLGRVLNLLAEHLEFAPCTEHNRIDSYMPHLERLGAVNLMATCTGMELTGGPLPVNHQNAFPLVLKPFTQDNGGPLTDVNPVVQIERLAMWDNGSDKLVQTNHPNLRQILGDANTDGEPDDGFRAMFDSMDVMEVHPPSSIFSVPGVDLEASNRGNVMFNWMQLLNRGFRIPGVVNTDAHYNFHGSGWLRNYVVSSSDDPAEIRVDEMVRNSREGRVVMTTGPFLEVVGISGDKVAIAGEDLHAPEGQLTLKVKVQCPNWLDVNRVQVFVNGRPSESHNFRRRTHAEMFDNGVVKFEQAIEVELKSDAHLIVATIGEGLSLGRVMGEERGKLAPVAVINPIFVDVDGNGFQANGDDLDRPLPVVAK